MPGDVAYITRSRVHLLMGYLITFAIGDIDVNYFALSNIFTSIHVALGIKVVI